MGDWQVSELESVGLPFFAHFEQNGQNWKQWELLKLESVRIESARIV